MRQGPEYAMHIDRNLVGEATLQVPLELELELEPFPFVIWKDNGDGTYTLTPTKE